MAEFWTEERTNKAVELRRNGVGCKAIAGVIGAKSPHQVSAKLRRLHVKGASGQPVAAKKSAPDEKNTAALIGLTDWKKEPGGVPFDKLGDHACKWPFADPYEVATKFCGKKAAPGSSYCKEHRVRAWRAIKPAERFGWVAKVA